MKLLLGIILLSVFYLQSCDSNSSKDPQKLLSELSKDKNINTGSLNFQFDLPPDWYRIDTIVQGIQFCLLMNHDSLYKPRINVTNESMGGQSHKEYVDGTKRYLKNTMQEIDLLENGQFSLPNYSCYWYTYNMKPNYIPRENIYYSIAVSGISYNITAAVNPGGRSKYRKTFDDIVKSFRLQ